MSRPRRIINLTGVGGELRRCRSPSDRRPQAPRRRRPSGSYACGGASRRRGDRRALLSRSSALRCFVQLLRHLGHESDYFAAGHDPGALPPICRGRDNRCRANDVQHEDDRLLLPAFRSVKISPRLCSYSSCTDVAERVADGDRILTPVMILRLTELLLWPSGNSQRPPRSRYGIPSCDKSRGLIFDCSSGPGRRFDLRVKMSADQSPEAISAEPEWSNASFRRAACRSGASPCHSRKTERGTAARRRRRRTRPRASGFWRGRETRRRNHEQSYMVHYDLAARAMLAPISRRDAGHHTSAATSDRTASTFPVPHRSRGVSLFAPTSPPKVRAIVACGFMPCEFSDKRYNSRSGVGQN